MRKDLRIMKTCIDRAEYAFTIKVHNTNGDIIEFHYISGMCGSHQMYILPDISNPFNINCILQGFARCESQH
jgi:hypothetical protein